MTKEEIGRIIKESRIIAGMTQLQVGNALNRPQTTIAAWETGRSQPDANTLFELFRVLGRSVDEAFGFTMGSFNITAQERKHIEKYRTLDSYGKGAIDTLLDFEYNRYIEQSFTKYHTRLEQIDEEMKHLHEKSQESSEKTQDEITEETSRFESLFEEMVQIRHSMSLAMDPFKYSIADTKDSKDTTPLSDAPEPPPEGEQTE